MKSILIVFATLGVVLCEYCDPTDTTSCALEQCSGTTVPTCDSHICTCNAKPIGACSQLKDCGQYWVGHHCGHGHRLCMNGQCTCNQHNG